MNKHFKFHLVALPFNQEFYFIITFIFVCTKIFISVTIGNFTLLYFLLWIIFSFYYIKIENNCIEIYLCQKEQEIIGYADSNAFASTGPPLDFCRSPMFWTKKEKEKFKSYAHISGNILWKDVLKDQCMIRLL